METAYTVESQSLLYMLSKELDSKACKILMLMQGIANIETGKVATSLSDLHKETGMAVTTIRKAIQELQQAGVLEVIHNVGVNADYRIKIKESTQERAIKMYSNRHNLLEGHPDQGNSK